jgi:hypothetical protein
MSGTLTISPTLIVAPFVNSYTGPSGISNAGTIIVNSYNQSYEEYDGAYQLLSASHNLGTGALHAAAVNNQGTIVGSFINPLGTMVGVIDIGGYCTTIAVESDATAFTAINDSGEAIGNFGQAAQDGQIAEAVGSFIDIDGHITIVNAPFNFPDIYLNGINNAGEIVGDYTASNGSKEGFTDTDGKFKTVEVPGSKFTDLLGINNAGEIVGGYIDSSGTLHGFIDVNGSFTTVNYPGDTNGSALTIINDDGQIGGYAFEEGGYIFSAFTAEVTCFATDTRILTDHGEIPVESLSIGDRVVTVHAGLQPIKWIGTRTYAAPFCNHAKILPIRIAAHAIAQNIPTRDLFVSPGHAIFIDGVLIHAARLLNGVTITQVPSLPEITYFHVELANHEVILAENCPAETYRGECFRLQFQNAESFSALYPGAKAPENFSAPVLTTGLHLAAILRRLRARAGIAAPAAPGRLLRYIDLMTQAAVTGWAVDLAAPGEPVLLDILAGRRRIGRVIANIHRPDVADAGFGAGDHGFEFLLPAWVAGGISVCRAADGAALGLACVARAA